MVLTDAVIISLNDSTVKYVPGAIQDVCGSINGKVSVILGIVALMWLFEPSLRKHVDSKVTSDGMPVNAGSNIMFIYKWLGIGFIFMAILSIMLP